MWNFLKKYLGHPKLPGEPQIEIGLPYVFFTKKGA